jgi:bacteriorhodopsin
MGLILDRANDALEVNPTPPGVNQFLVVNGSNWLWAVTAVYCLSFMAVYGLGHFAKSGEKIFHYLFSIALLVGSISYFAMASNLGWTVVSAANGAGDYGLLRQIFFAKYINWVVSFPVVTVVLGLVSGVSWATIFYWVALSWTWVVSYLISAFVATNYKWGFFAFGTVAWLLLACGLATDGMKAAKRVDLKRDYTILAGWLNLLWLLYPIAFGLSDGGNRIGVTAGFIFWGILDVLMVPLLAFATVALSGHWDYGKLNLHFTQYGRVAAQGGTFPEKDAPAQPAPAPAA